MNESTTCGMQIAKAIPRGEFIALRITIKTERPKISHLYFYQKRLEKNKYNMSPRKANRKIYIIKFGTSINETENR